MASMQNANTIREHRAYYDSRRIPDPFVNMNELGVRWVAEKSWTYKMAFPTPAGAPHDERNDLVFQGLDTFARVTLNSNRILEADNMFLELGIAPWS